MEEKKVIIGIVGTIIGLLVLGAGLYYLKKEKGDPESKKIYSIISVVGAVIGIVSAVILITHIS